MSKDLLLVIDFDAFTKKPGTIQARLDAAWSLAKNGADVRWIQSGERMRI